MQNWSIPIANTVEILQPHNKPWIYALLIYTTINMQYIPRHVEYTLSWLYWQWISETCNSRYWDRYIMQTYNHVTYLKIQIYQIILIMALYNLWNTWYNFDIKLAYCKGSYITKTLANIRDVSGGDICSMSQQENKYKFLIISNNSPGGV